MSSTSMSGPLPPDVNRGSELLIVIWLSLSIALLLVSLRFWIRGILRKNLGWDDYLILLASAFAIAETIFATLQVENGFGRHIQYLSLIQIERWGMYTTIYIMLHVIGTGLVRISVCLFVLRLMPTTAMSYRRWTWGLLAFNILFSLTNVLAICLQCIPLSGLWDHSVKARCLSRHDMTKISQFQGGAAVTTDLLCVLLPILVFRSLQVSMRDKVAVFVVLGIGLFPAATALGRTLLIDLSAKNPTWQLLPLSICACLEQNIGIAVASMPALRQLLTFRKKQRPTHSSEPLCNQYINNNDSTGAAPGSFIRLSDSDCFRLADEDDSSYRDLSTPPTTMPTPKNVGDVESCHDDNNRSGILTRTGAVSPPLWTERKISSAETVEMTRVSPTLTTFAERKPSSSETVRLSIVPPPAWGLNIRKSSSADHQTTRSSTSKRQSWLATSPLSPPSPLSSPKMQQQRPPGRFQETGLRHSRVATPAEVLTLGNPAATGYTCSCQGGSSSSRSTTPKTSPLLPDALFHKGS